MQVELTLFHHSYCYMKEFYIYAIVSLVDGRIYVGMAEDPLRRLAEHNAGKTFSTKGFIPWRLFILNYVGLQKLPEKGKNILKAQRVSGDSKRF
jgi:hypothetical protein